MANSCELNIPRLIKKKKGLQCVELAAAKFIKSGKIGPLYVVTKGCAYSATVTPPPIGEVGWTRVFRGTHQGTEMFTHLPCASGKRCTEIMGELWPTIGGRQRRYTVYLGVLVTHVWWTLRMRHGFSCTAVEFEWFKDAIWDEWGITVGVDSRLTDGAGEFFHDNGVTESLELALAGTRGKATSWGLVFSS